MCERSIGSKVFFTQPKMCTLTKPNGLLLLKMLWFAAMQKLKLTRITVSRASKKYTDK